MMSQVWQLNGSQLGMNLCKHLIRNNIYIIKASYINMDMLAIDLLAMQITTHEPCHYTSYSMRPIL